MTLPDPDGAMVWLPKNEPLNRGEAFPGRSYGRAEHTFGHLDCPACDQARSVSLARITPSLTFVEASALWISSRSLDPSLNAIRGRFIRINTEKSYRQYIDSLDLFFGNLQLEQIHLGH